MSWTWGKWTLHKKNSCCRGNVVETISLTRTVHSITVQKYRLWYISLKTNIKNLQICQVSLMLGQEVELEIRYFGSSFHLEKLSRWKVTYSSTHEESLSHLLPLPDFPTTELRLLFHLADNLQLTFYGVRVAPMKGVTLTPIRWVCTHKQFTSCSGVILTPSLTCSAHMQPGLR